MGNGFKRLVLIAALATVVSIPSVASGGDHLPKMTAHDAKHFAARAFDRHPHLIWDSSNHKRITDCKRISRPRMRCKAKWQNAESTTDYRLSGHVTLWYSRNKRGQVWWNYAYDIKAVDHLCQQAGGSHCTHDYHVD